MDRCLGQMKAFKSVYARSTVVLCRFHFLRDVSRRCQCLSKVKKADRLLLKQWMHRLVYTKTELQFKMLLRAIRVRSKEAFTYLSRTWLPFSGSWAYHRLRDVRTLGAFTTNRVENENKHLKCGLSERTSLLQLFEAVVRRARDAESRWTTSLGKLRMSKSRTIPATGQVRELVSCLSTYAAAIFMRHISSETVTSIRPNGTGYDVLDKGDRKHTVFMGNEMACDCSFLRQWDMPCAHIVRVAGMLTADVTPLMHRSRWSMVDHQFPIPDEETFRAEVEPMPSTSASTHVVLTREEKLSRANRLFGDLTVAMTSLGTMAFLEAEHFYQSSLNTLLRRQRLVSIGNCLPDNVHQADAIPQRPRPKATKRKQSLSPRVMEAPQLSTETHPLHFRRMPTVTSAVCKTVTKRARAENIQPANNNENACIICDTEDGPRTGGDTVHWVMCCKCNRWLHQVCAAYTADQEHYTCVFCM
ncbi:unnamed protein product [Dicrocoelium dendriticum]|nr:unnamed protein product [Dicrocoelium dendriticum]